MGWTLDGCALVCRRGRPGPVARSRTRTAELGAPSGGLARAAQAAHPPIVSPSPRWGAKRSYVMSGMISRATMLATLIIGLIAGPAVSLYGSPTVSPVTAAAWASEPLPP